MSTFKRLVSTAVCAAALPCLGLGQAPENKTAKAAPAENRSAAPDPAVALAEQRRTTAITLLSSLADEAKSFKEERLRARVLARSADALWDTDKERARQFYLRAWDSAEAADRESDIKAREDEQRQRQSQNGSVVRQRGPDVRSEVLRLAAGRDRALGEQLLAKLEESQKREASDAATDAFSKLSSSLSEQKRLRLAADLLNTGNIEAALYYADPALVRVTPQTIFFLSTLRRKSAEAADKRFAAFLAQTAQDPAADANTVSGLSSYAFTPFLYMTFAKDGGVSSSQQDRLSSPPDIPPALRNSFMQVAAQVLLRPLAPPDQDTTTAGRFGKYMAIKRLLPLFEQYLPDSVAELNSTLSALSPDMPRGFDPDEARGLGRGIVPDDPAIDSADLMQKRLDRARTAEERDSIYADFAVSAAGKRDPKARDLADKISDTELRKKVRNFVDFETVRRLIADAKDANEAVRVAREGQLDHFQKAWAFTQAAKLLARNDKVRAVELLQDALLEARRIGDGEVIEGPEISRAQAIVAIATRLTEIDRTRAWEMVGDVVKMTNSAPSYTGEDSQISTVLRTRNMTMAMSNSVEDFDVAGLFKALAQDDLYRAVEIAKSFSSESTRAAATIAIARSILDKKA